MKEALEQAKSAFCENEVPVGAVLVKNGKMVAACHNQTEKDHSPTAHAELLLIERSSPILQGDFADCTLYVTMEPCPMCMGAILNARIPRVVFGAYDERAGCCGSVVDFSRGWFPQSTQVIGGVMERECVALLQDFFQQRRKQ